MFVLIMTPNLSTIYCHLLFFALRVTVYEVFPKLSVPTKSTLLIVPTMRQSSPAVTIEAIWSTVP